jgi:hypothetical protein
MKVLTANPVVQLSCYHFTVKTKLHSNFNVVKGESEKEKKQLTHLGEVFVRPGAPGR